MRGRRQFCPNRIAGRHISGSDNDPHHASLAHQPARVVAIQRRRHQPRLNGIQLGTGIPEAGHLDYCRVTNSKQAAGGQIQQIDTASRDVLAHLAGGHFNAALQELVEQFSMNEMHLPQIRLIRIPPDSRQMLDAIPQVCVALDAEPKRSPATSQPSTLDTLLLSRYFGTTKEDL